MDVGGLQREQIALADELVLQILGDVGESINRSRSTEPAYPSFRPG